MKSITHILAILALFVLASPLSANEKQFGDYTIHYNVFNSDFLSAPVAKNYGITRSKNRAVLNVTVTKKGEGPLPKAIEANIVGKAFNVYQQAKPLDLREIQDKGSIYYIAEFPVANEETVNFEIGASENNHTIGKVTFQQQFFVQ
ncbi:MAG TPA: DUF4426 domain-containing protein [Gammaproteobacteria bacterium]|nr:DUF4426 domain-containing protein [Gammaproteobacteria bacterium]